MWWSDVLKGHRPGFRLLAELGVRGSFPLAVTGVIVICEAG